MYTPYTLLHLSFSTQNVRHQMSYSYVVNFLSEWIPILDSYKYVFHTLRKQAHVYVHAKEYD